MTLPRTNHHCRLLLLSALSLSVVWTSSCSKQGNLSETNGESFDSPDAASTALVQAVKSDDRDKMLHIFGPNSKDVIDSGDPQQDKASFAGFVSDYDTMHRWRRLRDGSQLLLTGTDNKAFPIPLKKSAEGKWFFDTESGKREILARRIGKNELAAIDVIEVIASAQLEYQAQKHDGVSQFAQKFISDNGKENGLYWPLVDGQPRSPLGPLVAFASSEGYDIKRVRISRSTDISSASSENRDLMRRVVPRITLQTER